MSLQVPFQVNPSHRALRESHLDTVRSICHSRSKATACTDIGQQSISTLLQTAAALPAADICSAACSCAKCTSAD